MSKLNSERKQYNHYDKVIKENLENSLPVIMKDMLGLDIDTYEELPDSIQHTKEREPDMLKRIVDTAGRQFILQIEFQLKDDRDMVFRMAEYYIMLLRKYRLPVKQFVIFLQDTAPKMKTSLQSDDISFKFKLIRLVDFSYKIFLKSSQPEVKMLALLANFDQEEAQEAVKSIVAGIDASAEGDLARNRYFKQLRIFVKLRSSLEPQFEKAMESVSTFFKVEDDIWYRKGEAVGEALKSRSVVENCIAKGFTDELAAEIADVELPFVKEVRAATTSR